MMKSKTGIVENKTIPNKIPIVYKPEKSKATPFKMQTLDSAI